jgi:hypothetical protein
MTATVSAPANVARARQLLHSAAEASKQLEENVRELVAMRAWEVLGYTDVSEMWEKENGFKIPTHVLAIALTALVAEGVKAPRPGPRPVPTTVAGRRAQVETTRSNADIARMLGMPVYNNKNGDYAPGVSCMRIQLQHGVPPEKVSRGASHSLAKAKIELYGDRPYTRQRPTPRRLGKALDEPVTEGFTIARREADEIGEIARQADVPKAEIYRQAVAEYLARYRASRPERAS